MIDSIHFGGGQEKVQGVHSFEMLEIVLEMLNSSILCNTLSHELVLETDIRALLSIIE